MERRQQATNGHNDFTKARIVKNLVLVSFTFLLSFTASDALALLQSTMNREVGVICVAVQYACGFVACLFLPKYLITKFGSKLVLVACMFAYVPYLCSNYYPVFDVMLPSAIIVGFASSLIFNSVCTYINDLASLYAEECLKEIKLESFCHENEHLRNNSQTYNSIQKIEDGVFITKQSLFGENKELSTEAVSTETEIAFIEFKEESPLNGISLETNTDRNQLIEREPKKQEKSVTMNGIIQSILLESRRGSLKNRSTHRMTNSDDTHDFFSAINNESKLPGRENTSFSSVPEECLKSRYENEIKPKIIFENKKEYICGTQIKTSDVSFKVIETITSRFFGFFGFLYQMNSILCNIMAYFIFQRNSVEREYIHNSSCVCGSEFCSMDAACSSLNLEMPSTEIRYTLTTVCMLMSFISALIALIFLDNLNKNRDEVSFSLDVAIMTFKFHRNKNVLLLIPLMLYIGLGQAFLSGDFTKDFVGCAWGVEHVSLVMISGGCVMSMSSASYFFLVKYIGRRIFFAIATAISLAVNITMLHWIPDSTEPSMMFVVAGMLGSVMGIMWCLIKSFIGLLFKEEEETAFGCYHLWHALALAVAFSYNNYLCTYVKIYILIALSVIALIGYMLAERNYALSKNQ